MVARCLRLVTAREVVTDDGALHSVDADSICVHGDTPGAVDMATAIRAALTAAGISIRAFAPGPGSATRDR